MSSVLTSSSVNSQCGLPETSTDEIVCHCLQIHRSEILTAAETQDANSVRCIMKSTDAGTGCTACHSRIRQLLAEYAEKTRTAAELR
ncbi:MAG: (2Fe-2S)-binding protein [Planctomycetes bacterium]|nr:(2Fe-2S)-binding protein [Planctomycetota bacterium]